jgi:hypothetical protein
MLQDRRQPDELARRCRASRSSTSASLPSTAGNRSRIARRAAIASSSSSAVAGDVVVVGRRVALLPAAALVAAEACSGRTG